jgi:hypothetical protein
VDIEELLTVILNANEGVYNWAVRIVDGENSQEVARAEWDADAKALLLIID